MSRIKRAFLSLTTARLFLAILFLSLASLAVREALDPDFWWHLRTGQYIWETRTIPRHDVFSYTASDHRWITHEWLSELAMYGLYGLGGMAGPIVAFALVVALTWWLVYRRCPGRPYLAAFLVLLGAIASAVTWGSRPQMLSLLLASTFLYIMDEYKRTGRNRLWLLPPLMALWVNLHSGYMMGLALIGVYVVGEGGPRLLRLTGNHMKEPSHIRSLAWVGLACLAASLLNPNGYQMWLYPFGTLGSGAMQAYIQEWFSPDFHQVAYQPLAILILLEVLAFAISRRQADATDIILGVGLTWATLLSARHIPLFAVAICPIIARQLAGYLEDRGWAGVLRPGAKVWMPLFAVNWLILLVVLAGCGARTTQVLAGNAEAVARAYPVAAVDHLEEEGLGNRIYNSYSWGGYLIWRGLPVFIDGRADVYGDQFIAEYLKAQQLGRDWRGPLERYDVDSILIQRGVPMATMLEESGEWRQVYADEVAEIFLPASCD
jgi:hypothetical protein